MSSALSPPKLYKLSSIITLQEEAASLLGYIALSSDTATMSLCMYSQKQLFPVLGDGFVSNLSKVICVLSYINSKVG